jgi:hypothetical protein
MSTTTENNQQTSVSSVSIESIDDFLPMPGAESIVTSDEEEEKPTIFSKAKSVDMSFLEDDDTGSSDDDSEEGDKKKKTTSVDTDSAFAALDADLEDEESQEEGDKKPGRKKIDKSGMVETFSKLIEEGLIVPFEDDKSLEEYSVKDWKDLIQANFEEREKALREQTPKEFFESLPQELQYAAEYVAKGGTDMKGLFRALAQTEEVRSLDPRNQDHQEAIARQYLQATNFGNGDDTLIEDQLQEWVEAGTIGKKAQQFKPKLDQMQEEVIQSKLAQQEQVRAEQLKKKEEYMDNIYNTLKPAELNGIKIDSKRQKFLWDELTTVKYESMTGRPTNLLGKLLEDHQFGKTPRYDLIAETLWLLSDPDDYKENIRKQAKNEVTQDTVRKLKTEEARKIASTVKDEEDDKPSGRKIPRPAANIFKRQ